MKKKVMTLLLLAFVLVAGMAVSPVGMESVRAENAKPESWDEDETVSENGLWQYYLCADGVYVTEYLGKRPEDLSIPAEIDGNKVIGIGRYLEGGLPWFRDNGAWGVISIPATVTDIVDGAFDAADVKGFSVDADNPKYISEAGVLYNKEKTSLLRYPARREAIINMNIPSGVTSIGRWAFQGCGIAQITIPDSVISIGEFAFADSGIKSITIPGSVTKIEDSTFAGSALRDITIPDSVTSIGRGAFQDTNLQSITIPKGVTSIESSTFDGCLALTSVTIPDSVTSIGYSAFEDCKALQSIVIPDGVTSIGNSAFLNTALQSITLPKGVTSIESDTFLGCENLTNITIPDSVTNIGESAFSHCEALQSITIPDGVTRIEQSTFTFCRSLTNITIPSGITSIGQLAFYACDNLRSINIPVNVAYIGAHVFMGCGNLTDIYYGGSQEQWEKIEKDNSYNADKMSMKEFLDIADSVTIHYNSTMPTKPETPKQPENSQKPAQTISTKTAKAITKTYGAKAFSLGAKSNAGTKLTYTVSDSKVAKVDKNGKVTIKACGITNITITAPKTNTYNKTQKTIKLTVKPKKAALSSVKSTKKKTAAVKWKRNKEAQGYIIQCATDSKFKKNKVQMTINKNKTVSATVKKLKPGKKYYVRICAYVKSGKTKVQGDWSKVKTVKVKK